jgi:hypothetical protein
LAERLAERKKKREIEELMLDHRLERMRQLRDAMAARHEMRARSRSVEREGIATVPHTEVGNNRALYGVVISTTEITTTVNDIEFHCLHHTFLGFSIFRLCCRCNN